MTRIDFYLLSDADPLQRLHVVCRLTEKACAQGEQVFIYSDNQTLLTTLDDELWRFKASSFVPHSLWLTSDAATHNTPADPALLSCLEPGPERTLLINLDDHVPLFFSRFSRTLEVVNKEPHVEATGRERYRFYKHRGYPLQHHKL